MFRDLKEYQEIAKIYADKVSKPENLEENRNTRGSELAAKRLAEKPPVSNEPKIRPKYQQNRDKLKITRNSNKPKTREELGLKPKPFQGRISRSSQNMSGKPKPEPEYKPEKGVVFGQRTNEVGAQGGGKPSEGDFKKDFPDKKPEPLTKKQKFDKKFIKREKGAGVGFYRRGTPGAQRAEFQEKQKLKAQAMAKARLAKKAEMAKEEYTPYDFVLDYLLSSEQAATIEEANYVMTEMDAETIQAIVEEQKKNLDEGLAGMALKTGAAVLGGVLAKKGIDKLKKFDPVGDARKKYQDKKATEYEKKSGTTKEDGYFR